MVTLAQIVVFLAGVAGGGLVFVGLSDATAFARAALAVGLILIVLSAGFTGVLAALEYARVERRKMLAALERLAANRPA